MSKYKDFDQTGEYILKSRNLGLLKTKDKKFVFVCF